MITPAVMDKPEVSSGLFRSTEVADGLCEYLEDRDPLALLEPLGTSSTDAPSSCRESGDFSLCNFRPKKDLPPEDCLDLLSTGGVVEGMPHETGPSLTSVRACRVDVKRSASLSVPELVSLGSQSSSEDCERDLGGQCVFECCAYPFGRGRVQVGPFAFCIARSRAIGEQ